MSLDVMKQALEALESNPDAMVDRGDGHWDFKRDLAITALRAAIEQPRQWQGLTADEIWQCNAATPGSAVEYHICMAHQNVLDFAEAIEAKLKEKNT